MAIEKQRSRRSDRWQRSQASRLPERDLGPVGRVAAVLPIIVLIFLLVKKNRLSLGGLSRPLKAPNDETADEVQSALAGVVRDWRADYFTNHL